MLLILNSRAPALPDQLSFFSQLALIQPGELFFWLLWGIYNLMLTLFPYQPCQNLPPPLGLKVGNDKGSCFFCPSTADTILIPLRFFIPKLI